MKKVLILVVALLVQVSPSFADSLASLGIDPGTRYSEGKALLVKNGWHVVEETDEGTSRQFENYPEITCGSGHDAVCSVAFERDGAFVAITVEERESDLVISGEY